MVFIFRRIIGRRFLRRRFVGRRNIILPLLGIALRTKQRLPNQSSSTHASHRRLFTFPIRSLWNFSEGKDHGRGKANRHRFHGRSMRFEDSGLAAYRIAAARSGLDDRDPVLQEIGKKRL